MATSYFDYQSVADEARIAPAELEDVCRLVRVEFPDDDMMYELHVLRACMAIRDGLLKVADMIRVGATPDDAGGLKGNA